MIDYYKMESVRDLIAGKYDVRSSHENPVPLPSWNRYPSCPSLKMCRQVKCRGYIYIFVNTEKVRWLQLEIFFFRETQKAFIRAGSLSMLKLFELRIIDNDSVLQKETF